jgi:hypothetical protein
MELHYYVVRMQHDNGVVNIQTCASSAEVAKALVLRAEGAPERACLSVKEIS